MSTWLAGFNAKGTVNGAAYNFQTYRVRGVAQVHNISNTEGLPGNPAIDTVPQTGFSGGTGLEDLVTCFESNLPGLIHMEAMVRQATFNLSANPFAAPIDLGIGFYYNIAIFYVAAGPAWECASFLTNDVDTDGDVRGLQPVSFSGISDGEFFIGGNVQ